MWTSLNLLSRPVRERLRQALAQPDRGEFGPMAYAIMVSAMVLLAIIVAAWGENIANVFMNQVDDLPGN